MAEEHQQTHMRTQYTYTLIRINRCRRHIAHIPSQKLAEVDFFSVTKNRQSCLVPIYPFRPMRHIHMIKNIEFAASYLCPQIHIYLSLHCTLLCIMNACMHPEIRQKCEILNSHRHVHVFRPFDFPINYIWILRDRVNKHRQVDSHIHIRIRMQKVNRKKNRTNFLCFSKCAEGSFVWNEIPIEYHSILQFCIPQNIFKVFWLNSKRLYSHSLSAFCMLEWAPQTIYYYFNSLNRCE